MLLQMLLPIGSRCCDVVGALSCCYCSFSNLLVESVQVSSVQFLLLVDFSSTRTHLSLPRLLSDLNSLPLSPILEPEEWLSPQGGTTGNRGLQHLALLNFLGPQSRLSCCQFMFNFLLEPPYAVEKSISEPGEKHFGRQPSVSDPNLIYSACFVVGLSLSAVRHLLALDNKYRPTVSSLAVPQRWLAMVQVAWFLQVHIDPCLQLPLHTYIYIRYVPAPCCVELHAAAGAQDDRIKC